jgi:peroxidase
LAKVNPKWNDKRLFYESRRILVAFLQHIVYSQFVPSIIGFGSSKITPLTQGYFTGYNSSVRNLDLNVKYLFE